MIHAFALAHTTKPQPFNADFYTAAATIIPVLFLAVALQSRIYDDLLGALGAELRRWFNDMGEPGSIRSFIRYQVILLLAVAILTDSAFAEITALISLYLRRPFQPAQNVLTPAILLVLVAMAGPATALIKAVNSATDRPAPTLAGESAPCLLHAGPAAPVTDPHSRPPRAARTLIITTRSHPLPKWAKRTPERTKNGSQTGERHAPEPGGCRQPRR
jgi:hypothetical protein